MTWRTECDHAYYFEKNVRPIDICFHFCPGCGKEVDDAAVPLARTVKTERKLHLVKKDG